GESLEEDSQFGAVVQLPGQVHAGRRQVNCIRLDRPRVDVTLRVSGFFRDAFANLIKLF
ncbi:cobaltochelatase, CobN subunit, partial [Pseudomonas syringae pv. pisi str. 1704B]